jgi:hypothetical protein
VVEEVDLILLQLGEQLVLVEQVVLVEIQLKDHNLVQLLEQLIEVVVVVVLVEILQDQQE